MTTKVYRPERRGGSSRGVFLFLLVPVVLLLLYLFVLFGTGRAVLLGSDARADEPSRSDTSMIAGAGGLLAVPRDTLVEIPGVGEDKVNAAFANGGPELAVKTLENLTELPIENYVVLDFGGTREIVDALGGITADIGRIERQQRFLQALTEEASSPENLPRLPAMARAVWRNVETNMNPFEAARLAVRLALSGGSNAEIYPGTPQYINGISYWVPDPVAGRRVVEATVG